MTSVPHSETTYDPVFDGASGVTGSRRHVGSMAVGYDSAGDFTTIPDYKPGHAEVAHQLGVTLRQLPVTATKEHAKAQLTDWPVAVADVKAEIKGPGSWKPEEAAMSAALQILEDLGLTVVRDSGQSTNRFIKTVVQADLNFGRSETLDSPTGLTR